jgi:hypothetical protein
MCVCACACACVCVCGCVCVCLCNSESQVEIKDQCVAHKVDNFDEILPKYISQIPMHVRYKSLEKENECCMKK